MNQDVCVHEDRYNFKEGEFTIYVDERQKTIVAVLTNPKSRLRKDIKHITNAARDKNLVLGAYIDKLAVFNDSFRGKAKCHPDDVFDITTGKRIAKRRCMRSYHKHVLKLLLAYEESLEYVSEEIRKKIIYLDAIIDKSETR